MSVLLSSSEVRETYEDGLTRLRKQFEASGNGIAVVQGRSRLVDQVIGLCYEHLVEQRSVPADCVAVIALGGYGRNTLFPHSDVDLLFLFKDAKQEAAHKDALSRVYLDLWDLKIRASATARTVAECGRFDRENMEFTVSTLDSRFLLGDRELFERVRAKTLPGLLRKSGQRLLMSVAESARSRHHKFANTIYHLEPNVKEAPGGLRDYNLACWLALVSRFRHANSWPDDGSLFEPRLQFELNSAVEFLFSLRCFLHYRHRRDDNLLSWEAQDAAAASGIGVGRQDMETAQWMRVYFRHARLVAGAAIQLLEELPVKKASFTTTLSRWRAHKSNTDMSIVAGAIVLPKAYPTNEYPSLLNVFVRMARQGLRLGIDAQRAIIQVIPQLNAAEAEQSLWPYLRRILTSRHAANALRAMRDCGLLDAVIPEFKLIDALVIRDFFHRYTVDEHSFLTIETLHTLRAATAEWKKRFAEILGELERPELLFLSLLLHDVGKGMEGENHVTASLTTARQVLIRLGLPPEEREAVEFLIQNHLEMSAVMRRDVFEPKVVGAFADKVGTPEVLKMLTLLTYGDISSVNPEAMTEWKAENLWHVYVATSNFLNRHVDEERVHSTLDGQSLARFGALPPSLMKDLESFLDGLPQRYLRTYGTEQVLKHLELASRLWQQPVQLVLAPHRNLYELTVVTRDKPFLFATLAGALSAWGMEIVKANAFSNSKGTVIDCFYFKDRFRTLDLNPSEHDRIKRDISEVVRGDRSLEHLIRARSGFKSTNRARTKIETKITIDDESSTHSTLLEVVAQDRPGLLYRMAEALAELKCNIEIALIDTEGEMALDVFYLTSNGAKLPQTLQDSVREALQEKLRGDGQT
ncbi:MAG: [protein-PII] uridylyltransferase [Acidobacteria bacterium]|nr:MAG: [protein-PII] uridylyltransferase [Acidobacteriota bacterium]